MQRLQAHLITDHQNRLLQTPGTYPGSFAVERSENASAATVGQLKAVGDLFYRRISEFGINAATDVAQRLAATTSTRQNTTYKVPWNSAAPPVENAAASLIGQLKIVFGLFGYETVMMENGDSESSATSTSRDCDDSGASADLNTYRKANDDDLVKIVLKWPVGVRPAVIGVGS